MFAKIENNQVAQWPIVSIYPLFPNTSFPSPLTPADMPEGYVIVGNIAPPQHGPDQKVVPSLPVKQGNQWVQGWDVVDMTPAEIQERNARAAEQRKQARAEAYRTESDPLFFQEQRGEVPAGTWLAKVEEIKAQYPT